MSITTTLKRADDYNDFLITCNDRISAKCIKDVEIEDKTFREAIDTIKLDGWQVYKTDKQEWHHRCPDCKEEKKLQAMERMRDEARNDG